MINQIARKKQKRDRKLIRLTNNRMKVNPEKLIRLLVLHINMSIHKES